MRLNTPGQFIFIYSSHSVLDGGTECTSTSIVRESLCAGAYGNDERDHRFSGSEIFGVMVYIERVCDAVLIRPPPRRPLFYLTAHLETRGTRSETLYSHYECVFMPHDKEKYAK